MDAKGGLMRQAWNEYRNAMPEDVSREQEIETRRAVYAGYAACYHDMLKMDENMSDAEAMKIMDGIIQEMAQFGLDIAEGRA